MTFKHCSAEERNDPEIEKPCVLHSSPGPASLGCIPEQTKSGCGSPTSKAWTIRNRTDQREAITILRARKKRFRPHSDSHICLPYSYSAMVILRRTSPPQKCLDWPAKRDWTRSVHQRSRSPGASRLQLRHCISGERDSERTGYTGHAVESGGAWPAVGHRDMTQQSILPN